MKTKSRRFEKLMKFVRFCDDLATLSTCKRAQCGAIVFDWGFRGVLSLGYNGQPAKTPNDKCTGQQGSCGCIHAEANALMKTLGTAPHVVGRYTQLMLYSTTFPCQHCAGLVVNSGIIQHVFYKIPYRESSPGMIILFNAGIKWTCIDHKEAVDFELENL